MITFLVDTENINDYSFLNNYNLTKRDKLVLFVTNKSGKISFNDLELINKSKISMIFEYVGNGEKNALDFQLVTYLALYAKEKNEYIIVSKDKGYNTSIKYLKSKKNININRIEDIKQEQKEKKKKKEKVVDISESLNIDLLSIFKNSKNKSSYYNNLKNMGDKYVKKYYTTQYINQFIEYRISIILKEKKPINEIKGLLKNIFGKKQGEKYYQKYIVNKAPLSEIAI